MLRYEEGKLARNARPEDDLHHPQYFLSRSVSAVVRLPIPACRPEVLDVDGIEFYGQMSMMKGGILFADQVTTVSPNYSREICTL